MRAPTEAPPTAWPLRIFRPWLVASAFGLLIGLTLIRFEQRDAEAGITPYYTESFPRAAVADPDAHEEAPLDFAGAQVDGGPGRTSWAGVDAFAPAAPISASTELMDFGGGSADEGF